MLESFAVASYARVGKVAPGSLGKTFASIAAEEGEHVDHAMAILRAERALDAQRFDDKVYRLHLDVMTTLAEMLAKECKDGHCEVCHASCVKPSLFEVSLSAAELRGASLQQYLKTLDMLGLPGEVTLAWVSSVASVARRGRTMGFRTDRASGELESGRGRTRGPARTGAHASAGRRDQGHPSVDSASSGLPCRGPAIGDRNRTSGRKGTRPLHRLLYSSGPSGSRLHARRTSPAFEQRRLARSRRGRRS